MIPALEQPVREPFRVATPAPEHTLFDANTVTLATFLGSPVAGGVLVALNYWRLLQPIEAVVAQVVTIGATALLILIGWNMPAGASFSIALVVLFLMKTMVGRMQGAAIQRHVARGGRLGSKGLAALLGLVFGLVIFAVIFAVLSRH